MRRHITDDVQQLFHRIAEQLTPSPPLLRGFSPSLSITRAIYGETTVAARTGLRPSKMLLLLPALPNDIKVTAQ
jgi:hypothetical protein